MQWHAYHKMLTFFIALNKSFHHWILFTSLFNLYTSKFIYANTLKAVHCTVWFCISLHTQYACQFIAVRPITHEWIIAYHTFLMNLFMEMFICKPKAIVSGLHVFLSLENVLARIFIFGVTDDVSLEKRKNMFRREDEWRINLLAHAGWMKHMH